MNVFLRWSLLRSVAESLDIHLKNWLHDTAKTTRPGKIRCQKGTSNAAGRRSKASGMPACSSPVPLPRNRCSGGRKKTSRPASSFAVQVSRDGRRNYSQEGSRPASHLAVLVSRDGRRHCSQEGSFAADQLRVLQSRSTETVEQIAARRAAD